MSDFLVGAFFVSLVSIIFYLFKPKAFGFVQPQLTLSRIAILGFWLGYQFLLLLLIGLFAGDNLEDSNLLAAFFGMLVQLIAIILSSIWALKLKQRAETPTPLPRLIQPSPPSLPVMTPVAPALPEEEQKSEPVHQSTQTQYLPEFRISYYDLDNHQIITEIAIIHMVSAQNGNSDTDTVLAYCFESSAKKEFLLDRLTYAEDLSLEKIYFDDKDIKKAFLNHLDLHMKCNTMFLP